MVPPTSFSDDSEKKTCSGQSASPERKTRGSKKVTTLSPEIQAEDSTVNFRDALLDLSQRVAALEQRLASIDACDVEAKDPRFHGSTNR